MDMARRRNEASKRKAAEDGRVAGPLNDPLIEAYERLYARLTKEQDETGDLYQRMALSQAARALVNAIENERLIFGQYGKVRKTAAKSR
jgi:hypothetical protein